MSMSKPLPLILEPDELAAMLDEPDLLIVDVCQPQNWEKLHLPGAVHVNPGELVCGIPPASGKLPPLDRLESLFSRIGYRPDRHIVVYDDEGGGWAGRFIWTLDMIGHSGYSYLNGGLYAWYREQYPLSPDIRPVTPTTVKLTLHPEFRAGMDEVKQALNDPNVAIWDARSAEEYAGMKSSSARAGHIPGAFNLDWLDVMDKVNNLRLLPADVLREKLESLGVKQGQRIITHCQTHHRSGLTYLAGKVLGYEIKAYDGSWGEWGNDPDAPIAMLA